MINRKAPKTLITKEDIRSFLNGFVSEYEIEVSENHVILLLDDSVNLSKVPFEELKQRLPFGTEFCWKQFVRPNNRMKFLLGDICE